MLLGSDRQLVVLDWESSELQGLPAMDLVYFLTYLAFFLEGGLEVGLSRLRETYRGMLDPSTFAGRVQRECLEEYARRTGFDLRDLRPLRLLTWLLHSRSEYGHFGMDIGGKPEPQLLGRSLFLNLWREELRQGAPRSQLALHEGTRG